MAKYIIPFIIFTATLISIDTAYFVILRSLHRLKNYGLKKEQEVYVIDWRTEEVKKANIHSVCCPWECINETWFEIKIENDVENLSGNNIYFSREEAEQMLLSVQSRNDYEISKYYPNWKKDKDFCEFYLDRVLEYRRFEKNFNLCDCKDLLKQYATKVRRSMEEAQRQREEENALRDAMQKISEGRL